jgi:FHS family L-fucose permease-like MFS transporter
MQVLAARNDRGNEKEIGSGDSVFPSGQILLFVLVTVLFFLWGMSNNLTDILVQQFKKSFELSQLGAQLV